jgi:hypothetical protein
MHNIPEHRPLIRMQQCLLTLLLLLLTRHLTDYLSHPTIHPLVNRVNIILRAPIEHIQDLPVLQVVAVGGTVELGRGDV